VAFASVSGDPATDGLSLLFQLPDSRPARSCAWPRWPGAAVPRGRGPGEGFVASTRRRARTRALLGALRAPALEKTVHVAVLH